jgi:hypothetical protein
VQLAGRNAEADIDRQYLIVRPLSANLSCFSFVCRLQGAGHYASILPRGEELLSRPVLVQRTSRRINALHPKDRISTPVLAILKISVSCGSQTLNRHYLSCLV